MAVNSWTIPKVGNVDPRLAIGIGGAAAAFVGWKWWQSRGDAGTDTTDTTDTTGSDFADGGTIPGVLGAVPADNTGSNTDSTDTTPASTSDYGFTGTTNAQWSQYAEQQLSVSDVWSTTDILSALGNYLSGQPLSTLQKQIVSAALAVAGNPPVGSHVLVSGGDTAVTVAPVIASITTTDTTATITVGAVAGAAGYRAYRSGVGTNVGSAQGPSITVGGLEPNKSYSFHVAALSASGATGPSSASVTAKTKPIALATPKAPKVSSISTTHAHFSTSAVAGAQGYNWYVNGVAHGHSDGPAYTATGLHSKTSYTVTVAADTSTQGPSHASAATKFKTK